MKNLMNILLIIAGVAFLSSCSSTGAMTSASSGYGYYDDLYYYGNPGHYGNPYYRSNLYYQRPVIIQKDVIVVPEQKKVRNNNRNAKTRSTVTPESRRRVIQKQQNRNINRSTPPVRRGTSVAPSSRGKESPNTRRSSGSGSRRGGN